MKLATRPMTISENYRQATVFKRLAVPGIIPSFDAEFQDFF